MKIRNTRSDSIFDAIITTILIVFGLMVVYPLYFVAIASFSDPDMVNAGKVILYPQGFSLQGYRMVFNDMRIWRGYINTFLYTVGYTAVATTMTSFAGYALSRKNLFGRGFFLMLFVITMYFNGGLIPTYMVMQRLNLTNNPLIMVFLNSLIIFYVFIAKTFFETNIPDELLESAQLDGCTHWIFFTRIAVPLSKAIIAVLIIYYAVIQWNSYFNALIYLNKPVHYPLQIILRDMLIQSQSIQTSIEAQGEFEKLAGLIKYAVIMVSAVPMLLLYPFLQRYFVQGVMIGSVKG